METIKDWDEYFLRLAYLVAQKSRDPKTRIGSVLVRDKNVIMSGYNSFPRLVKDLPERYENRELKLKITSHSEENTILTSARLGIRTEGTTLYSFGIPCCICSKALIQGGVFEIVTHSIWPNLLHSEDWVKSVELSKMILGEANIKLRTYDKVLGIKGFLDGKEIEV